MIKCISVFYSSLNRHILEGALLMHQGVALAFLHLTNAPKSPLGGDGTGTPLSSK